MKQNDNWDLHRLRSELSQLCQKAGNTSPYLEQYIEQSFTWAEEN